MKILSYLKHPNKEFYSALKKWAGLVLYFTYLAVLAIRILSQFNKIGEKPAILHINTFFALFIPSIYILLSAHSVHYLLMNKEYKKDTRKIRITSYSLSFISSFLGIAMQVISLADVSNIHGDTNPSISKDFFSFIGIFLSLCVFYPINIYCRNRDCKDSKPLSKEEKKHNKIMGILLMMFVLEVMFLVGKIINVIEREGHFIIKDQTMNLGSNTTYYFNFSTTIAIVCMIAMTALSTFRMTVENSTELRDPSVTQDFGSHDIAPE